MSTKLVQSLAIVGLLAVLVQAAPDAPTQHHFFGDREIVLPESVGTTTADRISKHEYPVEIHQVETEDNYVITMFRIPYSHKLQNQNKVRPAILLQHGLLSCSDAWIANGPNDALAYLLADAGYDVWMGNARGNRYSRQNRRLSTKHPYFWRFSWHEIGVIDIAAMIDYILQETGEKAIHYTGHSQGTTVFFVLMSSRPEYNEKIKTAHMLAPVAYMHNMSELLAKYTRRFIGRPNWLTRLLDTTEIMPNNAWFANILKAFCEENKWMPSFMCSNWIFAIQGDTGRSMNMTAAEVVADSHPAGASSTQVLHYMQEYESEHFRQFDYGEKGNLKKYGRATPPDYDVTQISSKVYLYYCEADTLAAVVDVEYLASLLPNSESFFVPDPEFTHGDFAWSNDVKEFINDRIIAACDKYENEHPNEIEI